MFIPWDALNVSHPGTDFFEKGLGRKRLWLSAEVDWSGVETTFWAYGQLLANVFSFKYLENLLTDMEENWPAAVINLSKAQRKWERMLRIMRWKDIDARTYGTFSKWSSKPSFSLAWRHR